MTREGWLLQATSELRKDIASAGATCPDVRVSFGWPRGSHGKARAIGQCWKGVNVEDGKPAVFISPELSDPIRILDVLLHELVHASLPAGSGHRAPFARLAGAVGLVKPWTATKASPGLSDRLHSLADTLGPLDHSPVSDRDRKRQSTRMLKLTCIECGYTVRTTAKWIAVGYPSCPNGDTMWEG